MNYKRLGACASALALGIVILVARPVERPDTTTLMSTAAPVDPGPAYAAVDAAVAQMNVDSYLTELHRQDVARQEAERQRRARATTVRTASVGRAAVARPSGARPGEPPYGSYAGYVGEFPCGGGVLPTCHRVWVESKGDPRIWNGSCYAPVGWMGNSPCGSSSASGGYQIVRGTWAKFCWEGACYVNAADAPISAQVAKAKLLYANGAGSFHWSE